MFRLIPDYYLEAAVRTELRKPEGPLTREDLKGLGRLDKYPQRIKSLTGLEHATNLTSLRLDCPDISDISPLASLTNLDVLGLEVNR